MTAHRHVTVTADEFPTVADALTWVWNTYEAEYTTAALPEITIRRVIQSQEMLARDPAEDPATWTYTWCASIAGSFPVGELREVGT